MLALIGINGSLADSPVDVQYFPRKSGLEVGSVLASLITFCTGFIVLRAVLHKVRTVRTVVMHR